MHMSSDSPCFLQHTLDSIKLKVAETYFALEDYMFSVPKMVPKTLYILKDLVKYLKECKCYTDDNVEKFNCKLSD